MIYHYKYGLLTFILSWIIFAIILVVDVAFYFRLKKKYNEEWIRIGCPELFKKHPFDKKDIYKGQKSIKSYI